MFTGGKINIPDKGLEVGCLCTNVGESYSWSKRLCLETFQGSQQSVTFLYFLQGTYKVVYNIFEYFLTIITQFP